MPIDQSIFRAYDIRGIVGSTLTIETVHSIGQAFASIALEKNCQRVVVARDGRLSGPSLSDALCQGLRDSGCNVIDIGQVPTPVLYYATHALKTGTGIMLTGSHNPANYNGLKLMLAGDTLAGAAIQELYQRIIHGPIHQGGGEYQQADLREEYLARICSDIKLNKSLKVAIDCGNGVAGELAPQLLKQLGCEVLPLYCEIDGHFPNHHPDPSKPENLQDLIDTVIKEKCDLGLAFDGDGDRLGVIDNLGQIIWADRQMILYARDVLSRNPGGKIIYDVKCTRLLGPAITAAGGIADMWKTGHSFMKARLKETGALLAGEMSGHIFFKERWYGFDDALYCAARLLEILCKQTHNCADVFAEIPNCLSTPELNISFEKENENFLFIEQLLAKAQFDDAQVCDIDGLRVDFKKGWGLVRASNTTPSLVIRFEADDQATLSSIQNRFRDLMLSISPNLELPF